MASPTDSPPELRHWSLRYCCYVCRRDARRVKAIIRVFSGSYGGEGFPACALHERRAVTEALEPLGENPSKIYKPESYTVTAYAVDERDGYPALGRRLWLARRRILDPSSPVIR